MSSCSIDEIKDLLRGFEGKQTQVPPRYSALKHEGESLYRLTRDKLVDEKELNEILKKKSREIEIFSIEILDVLYEKNVLRLKISCSSGTYIRTLVEDIAEKAFKTVATVNELHRLSVGNFNVENSYKISEVLSAIQSETNDEMKIKIDIEEAFSNFPKTRIEESRVYYFKNGVRITNNIKDGLYRVYSFRKNTNKDENLDKFIGLGLVEENLMKREYIYEN